ncbi:MAG: class I SAM-dependent methyltransferase [Thermomicrobiales bacterium]
MSESTSTTTSSNEPIGQGRGAIAAPESVRTMFDRIVPRYDLMNHIMTFGMDIPWRDLVARKAASVDGRGSAHVLDVATGTGDVAFAIRKAGALRVTGLDFSPEMIAAARAKLAKSDVDGVTFVEGDAMALPFPDGTFDATTVSFGLRNMPDYGAAVAEMGRVLRRGGRFLCLEMTPLQNPVLKVPFQAYFERVVPVVGGALSGDRAAYAYLPKSVAAFPPAPELARIMGEAGLVDVQWIGLGFGTVALHIGTKG